MRFFIEVSYDGKNFYGWQIQKNKNKSIEGILEYCLSKLLKKPINIIGAGRTDTGVHAKQMFAHFDYDNRMRKYYLIKRLNIFLPNSIYVHDIVPVKNHIHARFSAISRTYQYYLTYEKNPFFHHILWHCFYKLDLKIMNQASKILIDYNDFSSFSKKRLYNITNNKCHIYRAFWKKQQNFLCFTIEANRFLRSMVRSIIGTILDVGRQQISITEFINIIELKNNRFSSPKVPAHGLFLSKILYPKDIYIDPFHDGKNT
ncbi:tRNA pseudouridine(38-40) synthase TruA [Blattabacterium cuenoti]|uniref:tRNA pseudouridine(38-40) synthase TruA n=1 Tax=Blattabacterium cuenoti TaxID=1653831 RepID=UPI00163B9AA8|nr:tRNA pseudouridine(38-40) synthase TruA [Blattabacterium cuenoti]